MPLHIEVNAEPIPGYRLLERLGSGGFGEVWKAEAPGGLFKAIKFVQRDTSAEDSCLISSNDPDRSRADQEWKSLLRVKTVRHPFILLLDRFENIDNYLVIVMELADRTLADRFKECRTQGLPGIPRDELLGYMAEAGEVLDLMNAQYQLQHLDIKPQNLFLVHNHVKVADFGLVKDTSAGVKLMTITGGVTPVYAAPETFDGKFSRQCDLYSLAIVYQEMLTGTRPFTGTSMKQLILQHLQNAHDLTPLPVNDRPIIARALSKNPEDRFETCTEFIEQLRRASVKVIPGAIQAPPPPLPAGAKAFPSVSRTVAARGGSGGPVKPVNPNFNVEDAFLREDSEPAEAAAASAAPASEPLVKTSRTPVVGTKRKARAVRASTHELPGIVQPALIIGIGQLGVDTLASLKQRLTTEFGSPNAIPQIRLLAIDSDPEALQKATAGLARSTLRTQETMLTRLQRPAHYLKTRDGNLPTDGWLSSKMLHRIPREQNGAGLRALGRLAFVDNYRPIAKRFEAEIAALCSQDTPHQTDSAWDLGLRSTRPRVYLAASLTGNSSGMFLDVAYLVRKLLDEHGHDQAEIVGLFYLPASRRDASLSVPLTNAFAALTELQHYTQPNAVFSAHYETAASVQKGERVTAVGPALQRCIFMPLPDAKGNRDRIDNSPALARAADFLYRELATELGQAIDEQRAGLVRAADPPCAGPLLQSVGVTRIHWPRHALLEESSRRLAAQLVHRWMNKDAKPLADTIHQWTAERWESLGMRSENLIERFQDLATKSLNQKPESMLAEILAVMQNLLGEDPKEPNKHRPPINMVPVVQAMACLERVIGIPEESRSATKAHLEPAMIERALEDITHVIADECEQKLAELAVTLLEDPNYRLAGAEEALRQFADLVEHALKSQESLAKELATNSAQLHARLQRLIDTQVPSPAPTATQWTLIAKRVAAPASPSRADVCELVRAYTKTRYHSLVMAHLDRLYVGLRGHLSDQIREVGFCRARLGELLMLVQPPTGKSANQILPGERPLFPPGCPDLKEAIDQVVRTVTPEDLVAFDQRMQAWIKEHCRALLEICMGSSSTVKNLAPAVLEEADAFLSERLQGASVAQMYLSRMKTEFPDTADAMIFDELQRCLEDATPDIGRPADTNEITLVTLPADEPGRQLQQLLAPRLAGARILTSDRLDEMVFYHEIVPIDWKDLDQLGPIAQEAYQQRCIHDPLSVHTREDVFEWQLIAESKR